MANAWEVYYYHWAKEINEDRRKKYSKNCINKTIFKIGHVFFWTNYRFRSLEDCLLHLKQELPYTLRFHSISRQERVVNSMALIKMIGETLFPKQTPPNNDSLQYWSSFRDDGLLEAMMVERFKKSICIRTPGLDQDEEAEQEVPLHDLSVDQIRNLDAILAFM